MSWVMIVSVKINKARTFIFKYKGENIFMISRAKKFLLFYNEHFGHFLWFSWSLEIMFSWVIFTKYFWRQNDIDSVIWAAKLIYQSTCGKISISMIQFQAPSIIFLVFLLTNFDKHGNAQKITSILVSPYSLGLLCSSLPTDLFTSFFRST